MFNNYNLSAFSKLERTHSIMVLVGNGFDIGMVNRFQVDRFEGKTTKYSDFFEYIRYFDLCAKDNIIYQQMLVEKERETSNWSDFEMIVDRLVKMDGTDLDCLEQALDELQICFSLFLRDIVSLELTNRMHEVCVQNKCAVTSLGNFLGDLSEQDAITFPKNTQHYHLYDFLFVNFNYTYLLDNYLYLDKSQFDPHYYKMSDCNFSFHPNPKGKLSGLPKNYNENTVWSSYLLCDIIHPHGVQSIPRSMIFGTELSDYDRASKEKRFVKSYWAQNDVKYGSYFTDDIELFIIYGMSMGKTDAWWLTKVYEKLTADGSRAELIIYKHKCSKDVDAVKENFIGNCYKKAKLSDEAMQELKKRIFVVSMEKPSDICFLGIEEH